MEAEQTEIREGVSQALHWYKDPQNHHPFRLFKKMTVIDN